jgi:hypothetical protein
VDPVKSVPTARTDSKRPSVDTLDGRASIPTLYVDSAPISVSLQKKGVASNLGMRHRLHTSSISFAALAVLSAFSTAYFCTDRSVVVEEEESVDISDLNKRLADEIKKIAELDRSKRTFETFSMENAATIGAAAAHDESARRAHERRTDMRCWRHADHTVAIVGVVLVCTGSFAALLLWKHLWPVDRCRAVLRAGGRRSFAARPEAPWRFILPPIAGIVGFAMLCICSFRQATYQKQKQQRNAYSIFLSAFLSILSTAGLAISASFAWDASIVVSATRKSPYPIRIGRADSVCASVHTRIQSLDIRP